MQPYTPHRHSTFQTCSTETLTSLCPSASFSCSLPISVSHSLLATQHKHPKSTSGPPLSHCSPPTHCQSLLFCLLCRCRI